MASLALVKAVDGFDTSRDTAFSSYAVPNIAGAIKRHFRDYGWSLRMPRDLQELALRVERVSEELSGSTGTAPTAAEIAQHAGVGLEDVLEAREAYRALHAPRSTSRGAPTATTASLVHTLAADDTEIPRADDRVMLDSLLATLDPHSEQIVRLYYQHDLTQTEIGRQLGYSQMHVSRLLRQAIRNSRRQPTARTGALAAAGPDARCRPGDRDAPSERPIPGGAPDRASPLGARCTLVDVHGEPWWANRCGIQIVRAG